MQMKYNTRFAIVIVSWFLAVFSIFVGAPIYFPVGFVLLMGATLILTLIQ